MNSLIDSMKIRKLKLYTVNETESKIDEIIDD